MKLWLRCAWTKETASLKFEFHFQMCEFLAHSKELIKSFVKYQLNALKISMHHLHKRQATDCLLIPLALVSKRLMHFASRFSFFAASHFNYTGLKARGNRWEMGPWYCHKYYTHVIQRKNIPNFCTKYLPIHAR